MYNHNIQFQSSYSPNSTQVAALINSNNNNKTNTSSTSENRLTQTTDTDMNYNTTPTPGFKALNKDNIYYQQQTQDEWVVSTPSTTDSYNKANNNSDDIVIDDEIQQRHMQQLFDKKRKRRESHNAVERRRRDNINERIFELSTLLPERDVNKNNKGTILRKSVDHIRLLHEKVNQYQQRVQELESMLDMYRIRWGGDNSSNNGVDLSTIQPQLHHHYGSSRGKDTTD